MKDQGTRVPYRTARVLAAIAAAPASSNFEISVGAGIKDQGQISKLLARLAQLGLVENTAPGRSMGTANAWRLTPSGRRLEAAIRRRPAPGGR